MRVLRGDAADCPHRFVGQYEDVETGLYYNRHRYYDPATGQYLCVDPIRLAGGLNSFAYVGDPLTELDPLGLAKTKGNYCGPPHRGRVQAQGGGTEKSVAWAQDYSPTLSDGLRMMDELEAQLTKRERKLREKPLERARRWMVAANEVGGADPTTMTFRAKGSPDIRMDIEVRRGKAFVPDE